MEPEYIGDRPHATARQVNGHIRTMHHQSLVGAAKIKITHVVCQFVSVKERSRKASYSRLQASVFQRTHAVSSCEAHKVTKLHCRIGGGGQCNKELESLKELEASQLQITF